MDDFSEDLAALETLGRAMTPTERTHKRRRPRGPVLIRIEKWRAMLDEVAPNLRIGARMLSETARADTREGDMGMQLGEIAKANPAVAIGSYPFFDPQHGPNTNVVLRARDAQKLAQAKREVEKMLERVRRAQSNSS
jgi:hypothetical protein